MDAFLVRAVYDGDMYNVIFKARNLTKALKAFRRECEYDQIISITCLGENVEIID